MARKYKYVDRREYFKQYRLKNKDKGIAQRKKYQKTHKLQVYIRQRTRHLDTKDNLCLLCGLNKKTQYHHFSFQPNIFIEICKDCHLKIHYDKNMRIKLVRFVKL